MASTALSGNAAAMRRQCISIDASIPAGFFDGSGCAARGPMLWAENATLNGNNIDKNGPIRRISDLSHISLAGLFIKFSVL